MVTQTFHVLSAFSLGRSSTVSPGFLRAPWANEMRARCGRLPSPSPVPCKDRHRDSAPPTAIVTRRTSHYPLKANRLEIQGNPRSAVFSSPLRVRLFLGRPMSNVPPIRRPESPFIPLNWARPSGGATFTIHSSYGPASPQAAAFPRPREGRAKLS
jgi:hypothetical protein